MFSRRLALISFRTTGTWNVTLKTKLLPQALYERMLILKACRNFAPSYVFK